MFLENPFNNLLTVIGIWGYQALVKEKIVKTLSKAMNLNLPSAIKILFDSF